jgi:hypothetical protein
LASCLDLNPRLVAPDNGASDAKPPFKDRERAALLAEPIECRDPGVVGVVYRPSRLLDATGSTGTSQAPEA